MSVLTILCIIVGGGIGLVILAGLGVVAVKAVELVFASGAFLFGLVCAGLMCWAIVAGFAKIM